MKILYDDVSPLVFRRFAGGVHDLKGGAATQLLFYIGDDTHADVLVHFEVHGHQGPFGLGHGVTLCGDKVADICNCLERVVELDTGIGTVRRVQLPLPSAPFHAFAWLP